jgi:hypothetical protein
MRFFEFKLPDADSAFAKELESYLEKLIASARQLPETDPRRQKFDASLTQLQAQAGVTEDAVEDANAKVVQSVVAKLLESGNQNALFAMMDLAKIVNDPKVQAELKNLAAQVAQQEKNKSDDASKAMTEKAKAVAKKVGKRDAWGQELLAILNRYENQQLVNDFMDAVINGTGLTKDIVSGAPTAKLNLKTITSSQLQGIFDNKEAFTSLALMPFSEQTAGFGGGVGPGEALLAMLIPGAKRSSTASDLMIGSDIWEVKSGGSDSSKAWLDSSTVAPAELRRIFNDHTESLRPKLRKIIPYKDGTKFTLSQVLDLADFRAEKFRFLRTAFQLLNDADRKKIIGEMYALLFPSVKKGKTSKIYAQYVTDTIDNILVGQRLPIADIQAKLGMLEYALGSYQANNFIIYNYNTHELLIIQGTKGIIDSIDNPDNMLRSETITMGNSKKSSAGLTLVSKPRTRAQRASD